MTTTRARLRRAHVGLVGGHAPGFLNMQVDPTLLLAQTGISMKHLGLQELIDVVHAVDAGDVEQDRGHVEAMGLAQHDDIPDAALDHSSRYVLALQQIFADHQLDALAVRCWPELPNVVGTWPYLAFSRLADMGYTIAM
ncbi:MAG: hypothetical protein WD079_02515, partial [Phycisphaeraceae bacterium]